jgi:group I intron endonuclease
MIGIYKITSPSGKIYIGQSIDIMNRIHKYKTSRCITQPIILKSILKYGWDNHLFEIVCECKKEELNELERYYQDKFDCIGKNGMNCMLTTTSTKSGKARAETIAKLTGRKLPESTREKMRNRKLSEETREKISQSLTGRKVSEETKRKISEANKGKKRTQEYVEKMKQRIIPEHVKDMLRTNMKGKKHSEETLEKLRIAQKGKKPSDDCINKSKLANSKKVLDTETGIIYNSASELSRILNISVSTLTAKLSGQNKNTTQYVYVS